MDDLDRVDERARERGRKAKIFGGLALVILLGFILYMLVGGSFRDPIDSQQVFGGHPDPALDLPPPPGDTGPPPRQ